MPHTLTLFRDGKGLAVRHALLRLVGHVPLDPARLDLNPLTQARQMRMCSQFVHHVLDSLLGQFSMSIAVQYSYRIVADFVQEVEYSSRRTIPRGSFPARKARTFSAARWAAYPMIPGTSPELCGDPSTFGRSRIGKR